MARVALVSLLFFDLVEFVSGSPRMEPVQEERPSKQHNLTYDWFTSNIPIWRKCWPPMQDVATFTTWKWACSRVDRLFGC